MWPPDGLLCLIFLPPLGPILSDPSTSAQADKEQLWDFCSQHNLPPPCEANGIFSWPGTGPLSSPPPPPGCTTEARIWLSPTRRLLPDVDHKMDSNCSPSGFFPLAGQVWHRWVCNWGRHIMGRETDRQTVPWTSIQEPTTSAKQKNLLALTWWKWKYEMDPMGKTHTWSRSFSGVTPCYSTEGRDCPTESLSHGPLSPEAALMLVFWLSFP